MNNVLRMHDNKIEPEQNQHTSNFQFHFFFYQRFAPFHIEIYLFVLAGTGRDTYEQFLRVPSVNCDRIDNWECLGSSRLVP